MNKRISLSEAVSKIQDGMTVMVGGFLSHGGANRILDALAESDVKDLTIIVNDTSFSNVGVGKLFAPGKVKHVIASYVGANEVSQEQMNSGALKVTFVPQGTLAERIRCGGSGLGGFLTQTGLGTIIEEGKQVIEVEGKRYLLETPLHADVALIGATQADEMGNLYYKGTDKNFNPMMAAAADTVICEVEEIVPVGTFAIENVHTPGILIDYLFV